MTWMQTMSLQTEVEQKPEDVSGSLEKEEQMTRECRLFRKQEKRAEKEEKRAMKGIALYEGRHKRMTP
jgi:hypothetical protein